MASENTKPKVFISYSRKEAHFAQRIYAGLTSAGIDAWMDTREIHAGKAADSMWDTSIQTAVKDCDFFIPIASAASMQSDNVLDECNYAINLNKNIVPVLQDDYELYYRLQRLQWVDCSEDFEFGLNELIATLHGRPTSAMQVQDASQYFTDEQFNALLGRNYRFFYGGLAIAALVTLIVTRASSGWLSFLLSALTVIIMSIGMLWLIERESDSAAKILTTQQLRRLRGFRRFLVAARLLKRA